MPKKQCKNAFWFFMSDWKELEERQGRTFPNGFRDVQADSKCNAAWQALTPQQKQQYTTRAKKAKTEVKLGKQTGTGEYISLLREEQQREQDFIFNMDAHIRMTVTDADRNGTLASQPFPFMHMNYYYMRTPDNGPVDYCPAEFAIGEFTVENGITRYYHEIIKTDIYLGYTREALETSEKTHKLRWDLPIGQGNWATMYKNIIEFLKPLMINGELPPIYTSKNCLPVLPSLIRRLTSAGGQPLNNFVLYSLDTLFGNMLSTTSGQPDSITVAILANNQLNQDAYAYTPNIECDYHKALESTSQYCSLSIIRQWAFTFCDHCCRPLRVKMIPGVHCPDKAEATFGNSVFSGSTYSLNSTNSVSVLSATGVSARHRIAVSERSRDEEERRRRANESIDIIDHSLINNDNRPQVPEEAPIATAVPMGNHTQPQTAKEALIGRPKVPPVLNADNFPVIGGRGMPMRTNIRRPLGAPAAWSYRGSKASNSDSD